MKNLEATCPATGLATGSDSGAASGAPRRLRMRTASGPSGIPAAGSSCRRSAAGEDSPAASEGLNASAKPGPDSAATASRRSSA